MVHAIKSFNSCLSTGAGGQSIIPTAKSYGWNKVIVWYNSMEIQKGLMLITKNENLNRISGVILPDQVDVTKQLYEKFVFDLAKEIGLGAGEQGEAGTINDLLTKNTQHSVYYVMAMNPCCKMNFIGAIYNTSPLTSSDIASHLDDMTMVLAEIGLYKCVEISDCAGSNIAYAT